MRCEQGTRGEQGACGEQGTRGELGTCEEQGTCGEQGTCAEQSTCDEQGTGYNKGCEKGYHHLITSDEEILLKDYTGCNPYYLQLIDNYYKSSPHNDLYTCFDLFDDTEGAYIYTELHASTILYSKQPGFEAYFIELMIYTILNLPSPCRMYDNTFDHRYFYTTSNTTSYTTSYTTSDPTGTYTTLIPISGLVRKAMYIYLLCYHREACYSIINKQLITYILECSNNNICIRNFIFEVYSLLCIITAPNEYFINICPYNTDKNKNIVTNVVYITGSYPTSDELEATFPGLTVYVSLKYKPKYIYAVAIYIPRLFTTQPVSLTIPMPSSSSTAAAALSHTPTTATSTTSTTTASTGTNSTNSIHIYGIHISPVETHRTDQEHTLICDYMSYLSSTNTANNTNNTKNYSIPLYTILYIQPEYTCTKNSTHNNAMKLPPPAPVHAHGNFNDNSSHTNISNSNNIIYTQINKFIRC